MKENIFMKKICLRIFTICLLGALCLMPGCVSEIKAYAADSQTGIDNLACIFTSTSGERVSTKASSDETTVLIFGYTSCSKTRSTLNSISSCDWVKRSDIRVIFAETNGHTQEEVQAYAEGYQCPDMIFCYDESDTIFMAMAKYAELFGMNGGSYPVIALIDKNNKVQNLLTGTQTADGILNEIKKFEDIGESGTGTSPSGPDSGIENIAYGLKTIDNTTISTKANPDETTVLIFGYTTCGNTKAALRDIDASDWVGRSDIRVIYADVYGNDLAATKEFAQDYTSGEIIFCHDESMLNYNLALTYLSFYNYNGGTFPYIVLIDEKNKIQSLTLGPKTADEIIAEIENFTKEDENTGKEDGDTEAPEEKPNGSPVESIPDVTGLKASSTAKKVKLTWKKVPDAKGYIVYQYNSAKKTWLKKAELKAGAVSYTVKGLTPGTAYRFAVKAFVKASDGTQTESKSYASLQTATAPKAVSLKVTSGKKKAALKWKKVKGAAGYTVYYKTKVKGSWKKLKDLKGTSFTKKKLKPGKTYYFAVRAYKTVGKTKIYGVYSAARKVKIVKK